MDRHWFFTWRTYGTWLPGEDGFVGYHYTPDGRRVTDNQPGEPQSEPIPPLERYAHDVMAGEPVLLTATLAKVVLRQLHETAAVRRWTVDVVAITATHVHVVYGVPGDPDPSAMLRDWKSYASRALNRSGANAPRWWADSGSKRRLKDMEDRLAAIQYVRDQPAPLLVWMSEEAVRLVGPRGAGESAT
jgi:REP element-mobilizing transposase RayT